LSALVDEHGLRADAVRITVGPLSIEQAIGKPLRRDYAILGGKEVMIEACFRRHFGQAFTNRPRGFEGRLGDVLDLDLAIVENRALFIAALNAVCSFLGMVDKVRHCRDHEPEECGKRISRELRDRYGKAIIGMVGYQPAILENLARTFGVANVRCTDLDPKNIGADKFGIVIRDGSAETESMIRECDLVLVTGSAAVNGTLDGIHAMAEEHQKECILFGVTGAGVAALSGVERICPFGH